MTPVIGVTPASVKDLIHLIHARVRKRHPVPRVRVAGAGCVGQARLPRPESLQSTGGGHRASGLDMGTATTFIVGFVDHIPEGALLQ
jgi:hypothetical protein